MNFFSEIPEGQAIICSAGIYKQVKIAVRGDRVYASHGGGWVRLSSGGSTSKTGVRWYETDCGEGRIVERKGSVFWEQES